MGDGSIFEAENRFLSVDKSGFFASVFTNGRGNR
jgi:hypothetical protein